MGRALGADESGVLVLDLGTSKALAAGCSVRDGVAHVDGWSERPCGALHDGAVADVPRAAALLRALAHDVEGLAGRPYRRVVVGVGSASIRCVRGRGRVRTKLPVALQAGHVHRALDAAADIGLPPDHEILHVLPSGYEVDGARVVRHPIGTRARTLTAEAALVTVATPVLDALQRAVESADREIVGAAAATLVAGRAALTAEDRQRGVVLLDLGAGGASAAVVRGGALRGVAHAAIGGQHVTRDLAFALQVQDEQAEMLKRRLGVALAEVASAERRLEVQRGAQRFLVGQPMVAEVVEARLEETLLWLREALQAQQALGLGDRLVLAGGGARLRGVAELAEQVFEMPARVASPTGPAGWREAAGDPACCTALGLVDYAVRTGLAAASPETTWRRGLQFVRRALDAGRARRAAASLAGGAIARTRSEAR